MQFLNLKPTNKCIQNYYKTLKEFERLGVTHELAVKDAFADLLKYCCAQFHWNFVPELTIKVGKKSVRPDGAIVREDTLKHGYWEAKDHSDQLEAEIKQKLAQGYPKNNIIFWQPQQIILYQNNKSVFAEPLDKPENLVEGLKRFFEYKMPDLENWDKAASEFGDKVHELGVGLVALIATQKKTNLKFKQAFVDFTNLCKKAINPNISETAIEEMLIQHLLTERIFRKLFDNPDFVRRNVIAAEIENVINALTSQSFNRDQFLGKLDYFYKALENAASTVTEFAEKQSFLNTVYERFFQGFAVKVADTHGIVYTPQEIVNFMVSSLEIILKEEFGKSLNEPGVQILDPFVGTGNFILRVMRSLSKTALTYKYSQELHCNEVMLLPYYIASLNLEHEYHQLTGKYEAFEGICLVDTFELASEGQLSLFSEENTARVDRQKNSEIFVIIGNPPYNVGQVNENDNNKNRRYPVIDSRVKETYSKDSRATNKGALSDPYVKAIRWATDRIKNEGIVALVTNNSFLNEIAFDGVRKNLEQEFDLIYLLDLGGNIRKNPKLSGTTHNVFGIQVGVSINIFIKKTAGASKKAKIYYGSVDEFWTRQQKCSYLTETQHLGNVAWQEIQPDSKYTWLTQGLKSDFEDFIPIGSKKAKIANAFEEVIFKLYSHGLQTSRDAWVYNYNLEALSENVKSTIQIYNFELHRWHSEPRAKIELDDFVTPDDQKIKWSSRAKECLLANKSVQFNPEKIRHSLYRPFSQQYVYFDKILNDRCGLFSVIFPTPETQKENQVICLTGIGSEKPFMVLMTNLITDLHLNGAGCTTQCFPFYSYDEEGNNRTENISDWALLAFQKHYQDNSIQKWDIFYYIYGLLHHPDYCQTYAANLKRELPRIPLKGEFSAFVAAGTRLAQLHTNYEQVPEYPLKYIENPDQPLNYRVERMRLTKDKTQILYNDFLTLANIPPKALSYRLGNRSALEWVISQYLVSVDKRSGIESDPNRLEDEQYILRLIAKVITVSIETMEIVEGLPRK